MHKKFVNHCTIDLTIIPDGPILIKSGKEGADPTKPDMEFVETYHAGGRTVKKLKNTIFLIQINSIVNLLLLNLWI
jgi:hypothetical protein